MNRWRVCFAVHNQKDIQINSQRSNDVAVTVLRISLCVIEMWRGAGRLLFSSKGCYKNRERVGIGLTSASVAWLSAQKPP